MKPPKFLQKIGNLFKRKQPVWKAPTDFVIEYAFTAGGVQYFQLANTLNMPCERAFSALRYYEEMKMRTSAEYLDGLYRAIRKLVDEGKLGDIAIMVHQAQERLTWACDPDMAYKLASVMFFDSTESPLVYDYAYNRGKIERWRRLKLEDFFLQHPLLGFLPYLGNLGTDLATYTTAARMKTQAQLTSILSIIDSDPLSASICETLALERDRLRSLETYSG